MTPQWSIGRNGKRHLYYVSQALLQRRPKEAGSLPRVGAPAIEDLVVRCWFKLSRQGAGADSPMIGTDVADDAPASSAKSDLRQALHLVIVSDSLVTIKFDPRVVRTEAKRGQSSTPRSLEGLLGAKVERKPNELVVTIAHQLRRRGGAKRVEGWAKSNWSTQVARPDQRLIRALTRAHASRAKIEAGEIRTIEELGSSDGRNRNDARALLRLSFLAPDIQKAILDGRQPIGLSFKTITQLDLPASWAKQRRLLGLSEHHNANSAHR